MKKLMLVAAIVLVAASALVLSADVSSTDGSPTSAVINLTPSGSGVTDYGVPAGFTLDRTGELLSDDIMIYVDGGLSPVKSLHFNGGTSTTFSIEYQWLQAGSHVVKAVYGDAGTSVESSLSHTVSKLQITVKADDKAKYFNDPDPMLTVTYSKAPIGNDKIVGMVVYDGYDVGEHQIMQSLEYNIHLDRSVIPAQSASNYQITFVPGIMRILPTMDIRDAISKISSIPNSVYTYEDADKVSVAYRSYMSLADDAKKQVSETVMSAMEKGMSESATVNHTSGAASALDLPWNVRMTVDSLSKSSDDYKRFVAELPRDGIIVLYKVVFVDTVTGKEYVPDVGVAVTITGIAVPNGDVSVVREFDNAASYVEYGMVEGSITFVSESSGLFSLVTDIDLREGANVSAAMVAISLVVGCVVASTVMNKRFRTYGP
ncbi:MAG: hypothetical protein LBS92_04160 [Candidatus Methanoplasma sp.]|jgi:hypothetical protein|nr:hypothetical protein [Candidatus Methanoplasma sp.]